VTALREFAEEIRNSPQPLATPAHSRMSAKCQPTIPPEPSASTSLAVPRIPKLIVHPLDSAADPIITQQEPSCPLSAHVPNRALWNTCRSGSRTAVRTPGEIVSMPSVLAVIRGCGHPVESSAALLKCPYMTASSPS
jgi:hypothetical protein